jgi:hypothetical protein
MIRFMNRSAARSSAWCDWVTLLGHLWQDPASKKVLVGKGEEIRRRHEQGEDMTKFFEQEVLDECAMLRKLGHGEELDKVWGILTEAAREFEALEASGELKALLATPLPETSRHAPEPPKPQPEPEPAPVKAQGSLIAQVIEATAQKRVGRAPTYDHNDEIYGWDLE